MIWPQLQIQSDIARVIQTLLQTLNSIRPVTTAGSIEGGGELDDLRDLQLVNDQDSPGNSKYYGTNASGIKGYHALGAGSLISIDMGLVTDADTVSIDCGSVA